MTSVNTRGRAISWKGSLCLQGWDPLDVFATLIKELRDGFISPAVPMREHTAWMYTMLHSQMKREKKSVKYPDVFEFYINEATVWVWFLIIRYYSCIMVEKVFLQRRWECFPNTLLFFLLFEFIFNKIEPNREWRLRTEIRKKKKKNKCRIGLPLQIAVGVAG